MSDGQRAAAAGEGSVWPGEGESSPRYLDTLHFDKEACFEEGNELGAEINRRCGLTNCFMFVNAFYEL